MHAVSGKEDPAQEQGECNNEHLYEELTLAGFFSSRCNDDLWEMPAEGSGCAERNTTLELHHTAAQRAYGGPSPLDRAQQSSPVTSLPCYKFAGFEVSANVYVCDHALMSMCSARTHILVSNSVRVYVHAMCMGVILH